MPRQSFDPTSGLVYYRTKPLTYDAAKRFRRCLRANAARFAEAEVCFSVRAKGARCCYVRYRAATPEALWDAAVREQDKREVKATTEGAAYQFFLAADSPRFYWCLSVSGEVYEVTPDTCSCPDFSFRLRGNNYGLVCKHLTAYRCAVAAGLLTSLYDLRQRPMHTTRLVVSVADMRDFPD